MTTFRSLQRRTEERIARRGALFGATYLVLALGTTVLLAYRYDWGAAGLPWAYWSLTFLLDQYRKSLDKGEPQ